MPQCEVVPAEGGGLCWVRLPDGLCGGALADAARERGVLIEPGDVFFARPRYPCPYFRLRLPSIAAAQIPAGVRALAAAVNELAQTSR